MKRSVVEALALIRGAVARLSDEVIRVADGLGRVVTRDVRATHDRPRCDLSAMDGYALASASVRAAASDGPVHLPLMANLPAGRAAMPLASGAACPISTGAPIPPGADCVLPRENAGLARVDGAEALRLAEPLDAGRNVRRRAEDVEAGACVLGSGKRIGPEAIALLIAAGVGSVPVRPLPRLAIFSTGDELAGTGCFDQAQCEDSNGPMLTAMAGAAGLPSGFLGRARDDLANVRRVLRRALDGDAHVIIGSGGVSVGGHDHVREAVEAEGRSVLLHGVARAGRAASGTRPADRGSGRRARRSDAVPSRPPKRRRALERRPRSALACPDLSGPGDALGRYRAGLAKRTHRRPISESLSDLPVTHSREPPEADRPLRGRP